MEKISTYDFMAEPFQCDFGKNLFIGTLCNQLLNSADYHAHERNMGMKQLNVDGKTWVLSRFSMHVDRVPQMYDKYSISTWVDSTKRYFTHRNFSIKGVDGQEMALASTVWAMIDLDSRQPINLMSYKDGYILDCTTDEYGNGVKSSRVTLGDDLELRGEHKVVYGDLDPNGHVNSMKYIDHVFDLFEPSWFDDHKLSLIDVAFVAEGHYGDILKLYCSKDGEAFNFAIRCNRGDDETELCRIRLEF